MIDQGFPRMKEKVLASNEETEQMSRSVITCRECRAPVAHRHHTGPMVKISGDDYSGYHAAADVVS